MFWVIWEWRGKGKSQERVRSFLRETNEGKTEKQMDFRL